MTAFSPAEIWVNGEVRTTDVAREFDASAAASDATVEVGRRGDQLQLGTLIIQVLHPVVLGSNSNDNSLVLRVDAGESSALFTGEGETIQIIVQFSEFLQMSDPERGAQLRLETGSPDRNVMSPPFFGGPFLVFNYTVQAGDLNGALDYVSANALTVHGNTIRSSATGLLADLTLPTPGDPGSLSANTNIAVDGGGGR